MIGQSPRRGLGGRILSAYGTSLLGVFSGLLTNLWLIRHVTREVTPSDFGTFAFVLQFTSYLAVLQLGLDFAAARTIAERLGRGDEVGANAAYWEVARFNRRAALGVAGLAGLLTAGFWWKLRGTGLERADLAAQLALLTGGIQVVAFLSRKYGAALIGGQHQAVANLVPVVSSVGSTLLAFALLRAGLGVRCIPAAGLVLAGASLGAYALATRRWCPWRTRRPPERDRALFGSLARFGGLATLNSVAWTVEATSDVVVLGATSGSAAVAAYVLWWRFPSMLFDLCARLVTSAFPGFAERHGLSAADGARLLNKIAMVSIGLSSLALVGIGLWLPAFMQLWVGGAYAVEHAGRLAVELGALVALRTLGNLLGMYWLAGGNARYPAILGWAQASAKVVLAIVFARGHGIEGVVVASLVASGLQVVGYAVPLSRNRTISAYTAGAAVSMNVLAATLAIAISPGVEETSVARFAVRAAGSAGAWLALWALVASRTELRATVQRLLSRAVPQP